MTDQSKRDSLREKIMDASVVKHPEFTQFLIPGFFMDNLVELFKQELADLKAQLPEHKLGTIESPLNQLEVGYNLALRDSSSVIDEAIARLRSNKESM